MIQEQFNINIFSNDPTFCTSLATECNKFGFSLTFFEEKDIESKGRSVSSLISVNIIDLDLVEINPYGMVKKLRINSNLPIFGVFSNFSKQSQAKAEKAGFDLVFTKSMLIKSVKRIIIHISNDKRNA